MKRLRRLVPMTSGRKNKRKKIVRARRIILTDDETSPQNIGLVLLTDYGFIIPQSA
jgi:hypothetical protein